MTISTDIRQLPNELNSKIFLFLPVLPHINQLKRINLRISNSEINRTDGHKKKMKAVFKRLTDENVYFHTVYDNSYSISGRFYDIKVSQAILLCLDKYCPVTKNSRYFNRKYGIMCARFD